MHKPVLTIRNHLPFSLEGFRGADPLPTLAKALAVLKRLTLDHHVSAGTALGIHRDGAFIPHDTDLDLAVVLDWRKDHYPTAVTLTTAMAKANLPCVRSLITEGQPVQLVFGDADNRGMLVDLEFYYSGITKGKLVHYKPEGTVTISPRKTRLRAFRDLNVPLPEPIGDYLTERYGDWKTPTKEKGAWQAYTSCFTPWPTP